MCIESHDIFFFFTDVQKSHLKLRSCHSLLSGVPWGKWDRSFWICGRLKWISLQNIWCNFLCSWIEYFRLTTMNADICSWYSCFQDSESQSGDLESWVMKIIVTKGTTASDPASTTIIIEGTEVLQGLDVPRACALLMGLIYAFNLSYPRELKYRCEVFQKVFLKLDQKCSPKVISLKQKLLGNPCEPQCWKS